MTAHLQLFMILGAVVLLLIIFALLKRGLMSVKYSLLWLLLAVGLVIAAAFPYVVYVLRDLLDIEMPGISGMEIPQQVKGFLPNARIIFVTSHTEYAIDAFELSIFRYVPKNNLETKLTAAITDAAKLIELEAGQEYTIQTANHMEKIPYKDIFYIQRDGKNSSIVSSVGTSKVRKSLQRVFDELNAPEYIFIDRGYIVNIVQIMKVSDSIAILKNGDQLPISRSHLQEVKRQINQFWGAHI